MHLDYTPKDIERFWSKVDKSASENGCWLWTGIRFPGGHGIFQLHRTNYGAHRISYLLTYGDIPDGLCVCHTCDVRNCVRPDHLWLGTKLDNNRDAKRKNRHSAGERSGRSKINDKIATALRARYVHKYGTVAALAREFNLPYSTVFHVVSGKTWRHLN